MVDDGRTDGRTTEHGYTISSPCEPDGSGELKKIQVGKDQEKAQSEKDSHSIFSKHQTSYHAESHIFELSSLFWLAAKLKKNKELPLFQLPIHMYVDISLNLHEI